MTPEILYDWVFQVTPDPKLAPVVTNELIARYTEPHRVWHNLNHLDILNNIPENFPVDQKNLLILAILFHDAIYNVTAKDNEEKSAELFLKYYPQYKGRWIIVDAIESTKSGYGVSAVAHMLNKLDRAILCSTDIEKLLSYEASIWAEYKTAYSREDYIKGRVEFLRSQPNHNLHKLAYLLNHAG